MGEVDRVFVWVLLSVYGSGTRVAVDATGGRFNRYRAVYQLDADELFGGNGGVGTTYARAAVNAHCDNGPGDAGFFAVVAVHDSSSRTREPSAAGKKRRRAHSAT
jgi:hypothetical protein